MAGAPLVVIEIRSPRDETYEKFPFYAGLGVPEVWVFDRDSRRPELYSLDSCRSYELIPPKPDEWITSAASGIEFRQTAPGRVWIRLAADSTSARELGLT
jgi:Uma2 family endonuclease